MAEVLIRIRHHRDEKGNIITDRLRAGEIVAIQPNDWPWSKAEIDNPDWKIIKLAQIPVEKLSHLLESLTPEEKLAKIAPTKRRLWKLDLLALNATLGDAVKLAEIRNDAVKAESHILALVRAAN